MAVRQRTCRTADLVSVSKTVNPDASAELPAEAAVDLSELLTFAEVATLAKVSDATVRSWAARPVEPLPIVDLGPRMTRILRGDWLEWVQARRVTAQYTTEVQVACQSATVSKRVYL